jgi:hypothetical protein
LSRATTALSSEAVRLLQKSPLGPTIALIVGGALIASVLVAGAVLVGIGGGGSDNESLKTDYRSPEPFNLEQVRSEQDFECASSDTQCVREYLTGVTSEYGPRASLPLLLRLQQERRVDLSVNDHDLAHAVGRETAKNFGSNFQSFDLCPITFNYGCPHGFFEYVLSRTDTPKEAASSVCETVGGQKKRLLTAGFSCYHGVGHGVMMAQAYDLRESLSTCDTFGSATAQEGCWQGVLMENVNAGMTDRARRGVFSARKPLAPCDTIGKRYKQQCYINHAGWLMRVSNNRVERASGYCLEAGTHRSTCMQSIGLMVTNPAWQANLSPNAGKRPQSKVAWELCSRFPAVGRTDCVIAGIDNLANFDQLNPTRQVAFCAEVSTGLERACYRQIGINLRRRSQDTAMLADRCGQLDRNRRACLEGAGLPA